MKRLLTLALLTGLALHAQAPIPVYLLIEFKGGPLLQDRIQSLVSRELRKLGDVQLVSEPKQAARILWIFGYMIQDTTGNQLAGYAFSAVSTTGFVASPADPAHSEIVTIFLNHWLVTGSADKGLEDNCASLVSSFDQSDIEPIRKAKQAAASKAQALPQAVFK